MSHVFLYLFVFHPSIRPSHGSSPAPYFGMQVPLRETLTRLFVSQVSAHAATHGAIAGCLHNVRRKRLTEVCVLQPGDNR